MALHKYTAAEAANLQLFQNGFDVVGEHNSTAQTPDEGSYWVALQCVAAVTPGTTAYTAQFCQITATSNTGDDLTSVFLQPGDTIYGQFTSVVNHTNSNATLLGYRS
jgi:hypothetical protein